MKIKIKSDSKKGLFKLNCNSCEGRYPNSMDVRFSKACDNKCLFCIEQGGINSAVFDVPKMIESTINSGKKEILILGGEPFLFIDNLYEYVSGIRPYVEKIYITTALPATLTMFNRKVTEIIDMVDGLNCSVHYHTDLDNIHVLNTGITHSRLEILDQLLGLVPDKIRVMGNLCIGGLDNKESIIGYLKYMNEHGATEIKLNELQHAPNSYVNFEKVMNYKLPSGYAHGCQGYMSIDGIHFQLKRSCFLVEETVGARFSDLLKAINVKITKKQNNGFKVLYEDGTVHDGWMKEDTNA